MLGSIIAAAISAIGGLWTNYSNSQENEKNRDFQANLSNTANQRQVADLRAAGLNPVLSASLGGSSTPSGSAAKFSDALTPAVSTAMQSKRLKAEIENMEETNKNIWSDTALKNSQNLLSQRQQDKVDSEIKFIDTQNTIERLTIPGLTHYYKPDSSPAGEAMGITKRARDLLGGTFFGSSAYSNRR